MSDTRRPTSFDEWSRGGSTCPPPELFHSALVGDLTDEQMRILDSHVNLCSMCAAEKELAGSFARQESDAEYSDAVGAIVAKLESSVLPGATPVSDARGGAPPTSPKTRGLSSPAWAIAASLLATFAAGVLFQSYRSAAPELPAPAQNQSLRGAFMELVAPVGELSDAAPSELRWTPIENASSYVVTLRRVDRDVLWTTAVSDTAVSLPESVVKSLHARVVYYWDVEARRPDGSLVARQQTDFKFTNRVRAN